MKIGMKLTLLLTIPLIVLLVCFGLFDDWRSRARHREVLIREGRTVGQTLQIAIEDYFRDRQLPEVRELAERITQHRRVLGLRVFDRDGSLVYQSSTLDAYPFLFSSDLHRVLDEGRTFERTRQVADEPTISLLLPLTAPEGGRFGAIQVLQLGSFIEEDARASRRSIMLLSGLMILAVVLIVLIVTHVSIGRRSSRLVQSFREVAKGDFSTRVPAGGKDEFEMLAAEFNAMCARIEEAQKNLAGEQEKRQRAEAGLRRIERLAGLGQLSAGLAHEIGTPLNVISGRAESMLQKKTWDESLERNLKIIIGQIDRITRTVHGMLDFARAREVKLQSMEILPILHRVIEFLEHRFSERGIEIRWSVIEPNLRVEGDPDRLSQVFLNLAVNAIDAMSGDGRLEIEVRTVADPDPAGTNHASFVSVSLRDSGSGMPQDQLEQIFDPFYTTKEVGEGAGLGLSIAFGIIEEHRGRIEVESEPGRGTTVTVFLPASEGPSPRDSG